MLRKTGRSYGFSTGSMASSFIFSLQKNAAARALNWQTVVALVALVAGNIAWFGAPLSLGAKLIQLQLC